MKTPNQILTRLTRRARRQRKESEQDLRKTEIRLLRRQTWASWATVVSTLLLSSTLATLTYCQWRTAESTAAIERAKARPHFRITQVDQQNSSGFLPRRFTVQADAGVSDSVEATANSIMFIHFSSRELRVRGTCRARFSNMYGWSNDALSFELTEPALAFLRLSQQWRRPVESAISVQPMWVIVGVTYIDIFEATGQQHLQIMAGRTVPLNREGVAGTSHAGIDLNVQTDHQGRLVIYRMNTEPTSPDCVNALRVMDRIPSLRVARNYAVFSDMSSIVYNEFTVYEGRENPITPIYPAPTIFPVGR